MKKTSFSNDYRKCFFDHGRTHERTLTTPQRNTLLSVERTSSYHKFLKKYLIFHENTKPHQFLTSLINWYSSTATLAVHHGTSSYHQFLKKHLIFHENTKPHQFLTSLINWYSSTATLAVHQ